MTEFNSSIISLIFKSISLSCSSNNSICLKECLIWIESEELLTPIEDLAGSFNFWTLSKEKWPLDALDKRLAIASTRVEAISFGLG